MQTYRDHPLAFLCGRQSVEGLQYRAADWRKSGHQADGVDVASVFDRMAANMTVARMSFVNLRNLIAGQEHVDVIAASAGMIDVDYDLAMEAVDVAQHLRINGFDPYGGSVAATLEMGSEELMHLGACVENVIALADSVGSYDALESIVLDALDIKTGMLEATHEAPRSLM